MVDTYKIDYDAFVVLDYSGFISIRGLLALLSSTNTVFHVTNVGGQFGYSQSKFFLDLLFSRRPLARGQSKASQVEKHTNSHCDHALPEQYNR